MKKTRKYIILLSLLLLITGIPPISNAATASWDIEDKIAAVQSNLDRLEEVLIDKDEKITDQSEYISTLEDKLSEQEESLDSLTTTNEKLKEEVALVEAQQEKAAETDNDKLNHIVELEAEIDQLNNKEKVVLEPVNDESDSEKVEELEATISILETEVRSLNEKQESTTDITTQTKAEAFDNISSTAALEFGIPFTEDNYTEIMDRGLDFVNNHSDSIWFKVFMNVLN